PRSFITAHGRRVTGPSSGHAAFSPLDAAVFTDGSGVGDAEKPTSPRSTGCEEHGRCGSYRRPFGAPRVPHGLGRSHRPNALALLHDSGAWREGIRRHGRATTGDLGAGPCG